LERRRTPATKVVSAGLACPEPVDISVVAGGKMAFGTETSTSGYIFPVLELMAAGLTQDVDYDSFYSGSHDNSVLAVYNGDADFGVSFDDARRNVRRGENPDVGEKVIVFNITAPIANDVIAVDANLPDSLKDAIFQAMADFIATEEGREVMDDIYLDRPDPGRRGDRGVVRPHRAGHRPARFRLLERRNDAE
jgi:phosphonate transport system substrate-binding protein